MNGSSSGWCLFWLVFVSLTVMRTSGTPNGSYSASLGPEVRMWIIVPSCLAMSVTRARIKHSWCEAPENVWLFIAKLQHTWLILIVWYSDLLITDQYNEPFKNVIQIMSYFKGFLSDKLGPLFPLWTHLLTSPWLHFPDWSSEHTRHTSASRILQLLFWT